MCWTWEIFLYHSYKNKEQDVDFFVLNLERNSERIVGIIGCHGGDSSTCMQIKFRDI